MSGTKLFIKKLNIKNIKPITKIWMESLPLNLKSIIGIFMIQEYLEKFFINKNNLGIGIFSNDKLIGFVLFGYDKKIINQLIFKNFTKILFSFFLNFSKFNFSKLFNYIDVLLFIIMSKNYEKKIKKNNVELLIIAIRKDKKNLGWGTKLIKESLLRHKNYFLNFKKVFVKTLTSTPENLSFYKKNKFIQKFEVFKRIYLELKLK